jgi:hypothetical protein
MENNSRIPYHAIGMGDVFLTRKLPQLYSPNLSKRIHLRSLVDIYPPENFFSLDSLTALIDEIKKKHLKGNFDESIAKELVRGILSGEIKYFRSTDPDFQNTFFPFVNSLPGSAIDISTPNKTHLQFFAGSLSETKAHVMVETPIVPCKNDLSAFSSLLSLHGKERVLMDVSHYSFYGNIRDYLENFQKFVEGDWVSGRAPIPLGKVNGLILKLMETEGFDSIRNQNVIDRRISGGGIFLDLGPHCFSFLKSLGAYLVSDEIECKSKKADFQQISGSYHGETQTSAKFYVSGNNFEDSVPVSISLGKALQRRKKNFYVSHENGLVDLSVDDRRLRVYSTNGEMLFEKFDKADAFGNAITCFVDTINNPSKPVVNPLSRSMDSLLDLFRVQDAMVFEPGVVVR